MGEARRAALKQVAHETRLLPLFTIISTKGTRPSEGASGTFGSLGSPPAGSLIGRAMTFWPTNKNTKRTNKSFISVDGRN
jgi:hypothetical protein